MICSGCRSEIPGSLSFCPICGTISDSQKTGPSFERTWADLCIEDLKKKPSQAAFDKAWDWMVRDLKNNPQDCTDAFSFLEVNSRWQPSFEQLPFSVPALDNLMEAMDPGYKVLAYGIFRGDGASYYRMARRMPVLDDRLLAALKENPASDELVPFRLALEGRKEQAREALRQQIALRPDAPLILRDPFSVQLFTGLENTPKERLSQLAAARENGNLDAYLQALYRPLEGADNPFAHLENPGFRLEQYLGAHRQQWLEKTMAMLEKDQCLRGIHLAAQTIRNACPSLQQECDAIAQRQYEKAYMRPYSEIEATDQQW